MKSALKVPTDRKFGYTFAVVFALLGAWMLWRANRLGLAALGAGAAFAAIAATVPKILHPINVAWMFLGYLLNKIVSPIVLGAIYAAIVVPVGLVFRLTGRDALNRTLEPARKSYWVDRTPPGPAIDHFPRQF
jgi:hypothetical protein